MQKFTEEKTVLVTWSESNALISIVFFCQPTLEYHKIKILSHLILLSVNTL